MSSYEYDEQSEVIHDRASLLPAWFCEHMMAKDGQYIMVLEGGVTVAVQRILRLHQDNASRLWVDVRLAPYAEAEAYINMTGLQGRPLIAATTSEHQATISAMGILVAYEAAAKEPAAA